jgi:type VI secretion system secreted protein Hcp
MAIEYYLKLDGIKGEAQTKGKENQIHVLAWSWGAHQQGTTQFGGGSGAGRVDMGDVTVTHPVDAASPLLMQACCSGKHFDSAVLVGRKVGGTALDFLTITLSEVFITSVSLGGSDGGDEMPREQVTLSFATVDYSYQPQGKDGAKAGGAIDMKWDNVKQA